MKKTKVIRNIRYRLLPGTKARHHALMRIRGACRHVRNHFPERNEREYFFHTHLPRMVEVPASGDNGLAIGVDMNVGQVACSTGEIIDFVDERDRRLEARRRRCQRMVARRRKGSNRRRKAAHLLARTSRACANRRKNRSHHVSRTIADTAGLVCIKDLKVKSMTKSARGNADGPGRHVKAKAGLNRGILASAWGQLAAMLEYKSARVVRVNPRHTSQTCHAYGAVDSASRVSQSEYTCVRCGHETNADVNAALNIMASGIGASGWGGALVLATPASRQIDRRLAA